MDDNNNMDYSKTIGEEKKKKTLSVRDFLPFIIIGIIDIVLIILVRKVDWVKTIFSKWFPPVFIILFVVSISLFGVFEDRRQKGHPQSKIGEFFGNLAWTGRYVALGLLPVIIASGID